MHKTHTCGELRVEHAGQTVVLAGWAHRRRDHGNLTFVDLRDRFGLVQIVSNPDTSPESHTVMYSIRSEWVIQVEGVVIARPEGMINPDMDTGAIEVEVRKATVLNPAKTPPIYINKQEEADEQTDNLETAVG